MSEARELARELGRRIDRLVAELLPHGTKEGHEWRVGSLSGERGRSLAVHLSGDRAGVWCDFNGGADSGDALDLVAICRCGGDTREAMDWARAWLGFGGRPPLDRRAPPASDPPPERADAEAQERRMAARRMWLAGSAELAGTPAAAYLAGRGINVAELAWPPRALRFHTALRNQESGREWPALVAAIIGPDGRHAATHRTWLARRADGGWGKAPLRDPKMTLGRYVGGYIPLARGASRKPLAQAPDGETVALAEGIETGLSVAIACPELRVLSTVSLANMARVVLPAAVSEVILCADNDGDNQAAARALERAIGGFLAQRRRVRVARSPLGKDFNDALTMAEAGA